MQNKTYMQRTRDYCRPDPTPYAKRDCRLSVLPAHGLSPAKLFSQALGTVNLFVFACVFSVLPVFRGRLQPAARGGDQRLFPTSTFDANLLLSSDRRRRKLIADG